MDILIGTSNPGKLGEFEALLAGLDARLLSLRDVGLGGLDVPEDATTLEANAAHKARVYSEASGLMTLADDTGLFVEALGGAPGIYPARYGGPGLTMAERRGKLLAALAEAGAGEGARTARFECVIALCQPHTGELITVRGICPGRIALEEAHGEGGFGYDPVFIPDGYRESFSQLPEAVKNQISHRGRAAQMMVAELRRLSASGSG
ncbi:MAG: non-canonical purine NTP pyrophosphatase [Anaerolineae bacterium]|nr:non-canonical purine NTP pyrophosphatase [Anaerolineae bacterium]